MHGLEIEYWGQVEFIFLDASDPATQELRALLGYRAQPHLFFLDAKGNVVQQHIGGMSDEDLRKILDDLIAS